MTYNYEKQAQDFLNITSTKLYITYNGIGENSYWNDGIKRNIFNILLRNDICY